MQSKFSDWTAKAKLVSLREPLWNLLGDLINHAPDEPEMEQLKNEADAIRDNRLLLQEPDPIQPILNAITENVVTILNNRKQQYNAIYDQKMTDLQLQANISKI